MFPVRGKTIYIRKEDFFVNFTHLFDAVGLCNQLKALGEDPHFQYEVLECGPLSSGMYASPNLGLAFCEANGIRDFAGIPQTNCELDEQASGELIDVSLPTSPNCARVRGSTATGASDAWFFCCFM